MSSPCHQRHAQPHIFTTESHHQVPPLRKKTADLVWLPQTIFNPRCFKDPPPPKLVVCGAKTRHGVGRQESTLTTHSGRAQFVLRTRRSAFRSFVVRGIANEQNLRRRGWIQQPVSRRRRFLGTNRKNESNFSNSMNASWADRVVCAVKALWIFCWVTTNEPVNFSHILSNCQTER